MPVNRSLTTLSASDQDRVLRVFERLVDYGLAVKMSHARHLQGKQSELSMDGRPISYRIIYAALPDGKFLLQHPFAKKTQATPAREIDTARRRLADYERRTSHEQGQRP